MAKARDEMTRRERELLEHLVKERAKELERANERLFLANQVKSEFLAHMSEDLRSPLNRIIDAADLMLDGAMGDMRREQRICLQDIAESGLMLRSMVDRILDLCTLDVGINRFLPRPIPIGDLVEKAVKRMQELSRRYGISIRVEYEGDMGAITADEKKFSLIMEELLTNAVKFSGEGSEVRVFVRELTLEGDGGKRYLEVSVRDQGAGIGPEEMERIFRGFERGGAAPVAPGSLGIGLAIVKRFVELHGGKIWVYSRPKEGSTFTFILPKEGPLTSKRRIPQVMVADSDPTVVWLLVDFLKEDGYEVSVAANGLEVLSKGIEAPPDLFILESNLSEMNGIDVCMRLKSHTHTRHVPVILMSGVEEQVEKIRSAKAGADALFTKPFDMNELILKIRSLVTQKLNYDFLKLSYAIAESEASTDPLTGLCNRRHLLIAMEHELDRGGRYGRPYSIAMIDIDYFKHYNDKYGHLQGDEVLKQAADIFRESVRNSDIVARYGGEEFVVIMPETGKELALIVGEKLRKGFAEHSFTQAEGRSGDRLTISIGIATFPQDAKGVKGLLDKADKALYRAKQEGRDRVNAWGLCALS